MKSLHQRWGDPRALDVLAGRAITGATTPPPEDCPALAGRLLRAPEVSLALRAQVRVALPPLVAGLTDPGALWRPFATELDEVMRSWAGDHDRSIERILEVLWARDDVASVHRAYAAARVGWALMDTRTSGATRLDETLVDLKDWADRFDDAARGWEQEARGILVRSSLLAEQRASIEGLQRLISQSDLSWWLDLVHPELLAAGRRRGWTYWVDRPVPERARTAAPLLVAAAASLLPHGPLEEHDLGGNAKLSLFHDVRHELRAQVFGLDETGRYELVWQGERAGAAPLERRADLWVCAPSEEVLEAVRIGVRRVAA